MSDKKVVFIAFAIEDERQRDVVIVEMQPVHARHQRRPCRAQL